MMEPQKSILGKLTNSEQVEEEGDIYQEDDYLACGVSRKAWGGEPMIDFIKVGGNHHAFNYSHLYQISFDPSSGIIIEYTNHQVTILGRRLRDLYRFFAAHRIVFVTEADSATIKQMDDSNKPVVTSLVIDVTTINEADR